MNSGLGGPGNPNNEHCVEDGAFISENYTPYSCDFNSGDECCLVRIDCNNNPNNPDALCLFMSPAEQIDLITQWDVYGTDERRTTFNGYRIDLERDGGHAAAHNNIGGPGGHLSNLAMSPDDPVSTKVSTHKRRLEKKMCVQVDTCIYTLYLGIMINLRRILTEYRLKFFLVSTNPYVT